MNILITAGPTREYLDDVRYLSNASTGRMGYALAAVAASRGHGVTLVTGPTSLPIPDGLRAVRQVISARDMLAAVSEEFDSAEAMIACAAVSDYRPADRVSGKMKRESQEVLHLELVRNPDIVAAMCRRRRQGQILVGFALEAADGEANAIGKLRGKGLDAIVLNAVSAIGADENDVTIYFADDRPAERSRGPKDIVAGAILQAVERLQANES